MIVFEAPASASASCYSRRCSARQPGTKAVFTRDDGSWYATGDRFSWPQLAHTLRQVAKHGADYMYTGPWAENLVEAVQSEGGKTTLEDLRRYESIWKAPLGSTFRGHDAHATAQPNLGGVNMVEAPNLVEQADFGRPGPAAAHRDQPGADYQKRQARAGLL